MQPAVEYPEFSVSNLPTIVPVVLPPSADRSLSGRVRNLAIRGADHSGWLVNEGDGWTLKKIMERQHFALLEDLYTAENNAQGWAAYKRYLKDWQRGKTTRAFPQHLLPIEVQKRQAGEVSAEFQDPWNLPTPPATTGVTSEPKAKGK